MKTTLLVIAFVLFSFSASAQLSFNQLDIRLQKLALCESGFKPVVIVDTNGLKSYHWFQYQLHTFMRFGKDSGLLPEELTEKEARLLIGNLHIQAAITEWALDNGLHRAWFNCSKKLGWI